VNIVSIFKVLICSPKINLRLLFSQNPKLSPLVKICIEVVYFKQKNMYKLILQQYHNWMWLLYILLSYMLLSSMIIVGEVWTLV